MRLAMIGSGYVGLVSGACFAEFGVNVIGVDKNADKITRLQKGEIPIYEPGLDELVKKNMAAGRLSFTTDLKSAVAGADAVFIAVGTPTRRGDGHADLSYVYEAAKEIADALTGYTVIVDKSTVPVGTATEVEKIIRERRPDAKFDVCSNPEFLREGAAIDDFMHPDRVVIGSSSAKAEAVMRQLYQPLLALETPILFTTREAAELIKYAANGFLAMKITFIHEIADLCERLGADVQDVARGIGLDSRIGKRFLQPGPGYGGSCFPKDTLALMRTAQEAGAPVKLIEATVDVNNERKKAMAQKVIESVGGSVEGKKVAVLGLAFKADTDDMRDSPAIDIVNELQKAGAKVHAFDPVAMTEAAKVLQNVTYGKDVYDVCDNADVAVIVTEWKEFRALDLGRMRETMAAPVLVDLRNLYEPQQVVDAGFIYASVGRPTPARKAQADVTLKVLTSAAA
jgi:UDPglucose 6-dehydrogenase